MKKYYIKDYLLKEFNNFDKSKQLGGLKKSNYSSKLIASKYLFVKTGL